MSRTTVIEMIESEIERLERARKTLAGLGSDLSVKVKMRGKRRKLSLEGRKRIAEAVRLRWAAQKKAVAAGK